MHRTAVDRRRRHATSRKVKIRRSPLRQHVERPGSTSPSRVPRPDSQQDHARAVEVRGAPRLRQVHAIRQGHVGLRRHSAHNASAAASAKFFGALHSIADFQVMQVPVWPNG